MGSLMACNRYAQVDASGCVQHNIILDKTAFVRSNVMNV